MCNSYTVLLAIWKYTSDTFYRFPPSSTALCRHGLPFQAGSHPIIKFSAAIGTEKTMSEVVDFTEVKYEKNFNLQSS